MKYSVRWIVAIIVVFAAVQLAACAPAPVAKAKIAPSKLEPIEGTNFKRVVLTEKAAERVDIQKVAIRAGLADRVRSIGGEVVARPTKPAAALAPALERSASAGVTTPAADTAVDAQATDLSRVWVRVNLTESELNQVDRGRPARVLSLASGDEEDSDNEETGLEAELDEDINGVDDAEETARHEGSASLYYAVDNPDNVLAQGQPVFVKLTLAGSGTERKIVPFEALLYGVHGETWVYTNPEPLVFVRAPVTVDYIEDDLVFLSEGPPVGTEVVTVGGSLLYGAETGVSK
jgi:hypothetical protein